MADALRSTKMDGNKHENVFSKVGETRSRYPPKLASLPPGGNLPIGWEPRVYSL